jgi:hypothetical protein
MSEEDPQQ